MSHSIFSRILCATLSMSALFPVAAHAQSEIFQKRSLKHNEHAARGCIARVDLKTAKQVLERFNLTSEGATETETRALGTALVWIEQLHAGKPHELARGKNEDPYAFKFTGGRNSRQTVHNIVIGRAGEHKFGENVAQLVHELGHYVGNQGAYEEYFAATKGEYCKISGYSDDKRNEQFAEAFAAFVTRPSMMKNNQSAGCQRAYRYFSRKFFANGEIAEMCLDGKVDAAELASLTGKQNKISPIAVSRVETKPVEKAVERAVEKSADRTADRTAARPTSIPTARSDERTARIAAPVKAPVPEVGIPSDIPPGMESASEIVHGI